MDSMRVQARACDGQNSSGSAVGTVHCSLYESVAYRQYLHVSVNVVRFNINLTLNREILPATNYEAHNLLSHDAHCQGEDTSTIFLVRSVFPTFSFSLIDSTVLTPS